MPREYFTWDRGIEILAAGGPASRLAASIAIETRQMLAAYVLVHAGG